jgi:hypothetical protein
MISGFQGSSGGLMVVMTINFTMKIGKYFWLFVVTYYYYKLLNTMWQGQGNAQLLNQMQTQILGQTQTQTQGQLQGQMQGQVQAQMQMQTQRQLERMQEQVMTSDRGFYRTGEKVQHPLLEQQIKLPKRKATGKIKEKTFRNIRYAPILSPFAPLPKNMEKIFGTATTKPKTRRKTKR